MAYAIIMLTRLAKERQLNGLAAFNCLDGDVPL